MHGGSVGGSGVTVLEQSSALLEYLAAVAREIGPRPVRNVKEYHFTLWPAEVPNCRAVRLGPAGDWQSWLEVERVARPDPVRLPASLNSLVENTESLEAPHETPRLSPEAVDARVADRLSAEFGSYEVTDDLSQPPERAPRAMDIRNEIETTFTSWLDRVWAPWAEEARPIFDARRLYARLYDLHLQAEAESATHEVVWGYFVLSFLNGAERVIAPMLTTDVTIQVDPDDATIRVVPEQAVGLELDSIEGTDLTGIEGLAALQLALRAAPPDPWSPDERLVVRRRIVAPLGVDAELYDSSEPAAPDRAPLINDGWVLFMRPRPMRQERFYQQLAQKIRDDEHFPEALASVVTDSDRVDAALVSSGREVCRDDGSADRLLMPLPSNAEQERIARQLATSRGVTVQGPPGTGKSHAIVNLVSHLVAQGKRVLVTAEKEQALSVLRDKIPEPLRDLSIAVLGSTPSALEDLRSAVQSMQDSLSSIDVRSEERRITELGARVDELRENLLRIDAALVEALRSEEREFHLSKGPVRAPQVAEWLSENREMDLVGDRVPVDSALPITPDELAELCSLLSSVSLDDEEAALLDLPNKPWLPTGAEVRKGFERLDELRGQVTDLEDSGLRVERLDAIPLVEIQQLADAVREAAETRRTLAGPWEDTFASAVRFANPAASWVVQHNATVRDELVAARSLADGLVGHVVSVPDGDPAAQLRLIQEWSERLDAGKKISWFSSKDLKEFSSHVTIDGYPATTSTHLDLARTEVQLREALREAHTAMLQAFAPLQIPVPPLDENFRFAAEERAERVARLYSWWAGEYPQLICRIQPFISPPNPALPPGALEDIVRLLDAAAARFEERRVAAGLETLKQKLRSAARAPGASPLWSALLSALEFARPDQWVAAADETQRLVSIRVKVLRYRELLERIRTGGAPRWARSIEESRGDPAVTGQPDCLTLVWERARARTWLTTLHAQTDIAALMERSHAESRELRDAIIELASRSARVQLKKNLKDAQRRALETWLTAIKRIGKGTGKNAPRFQAAAREALPAAMGSVPIWIMPIYRVMENFDPRISELFDVVVVDESSQCDLLSLGVLALGRKSVVVGDDKQTTPERVGTKTDRVGALQDQHLRTIPGAKLLTLDESLYSISSRAFSSTIALKEHFRCVPEIIDFSNRFYNGAIRPLREVSVPKIGDPLRVVRVENAVSILRGSNRVNSDEAAAIADQVAACIAEPAYNGLTFGVVTMMSGPQAQIIQDLIRERIGDAEFERRRLRVGNPPLFQGDERNVIFVSMVAHDNSFAATTPRYAQWANVAVSRAQDQLWVFHSMDPTTLHHEDQRRAIIEYAQSNGRRDQQKALYQLTESKFERDVLKQMLERGYDVEPQHRVGSYRIDFVVRVGPGARLAVECDGDSFHGPDKWDEDVRRQRVLERLGWNFWRVRASAYYLDPESAMKPLWTRLEDMRKYLVDAAAVDRAPDVSGEQYRPARAADPVAPRLAVRSERWMNPLR